MCNKQEPMIFRKALDLNFVSGHFLKESMVLQGFADVGVKLIIVV